MHLVSSLSFITPIYILDIENWRFLGLNVSVVDEKLNQFASQANQKGEKSDDGTWGIVIRSLVEMVNFLSSAVNMLPNRPHYLFSLLNSIWYTGVA